MQNYILVYKIEDQKDAKYFEDTLVQEYQEYRKEVRHDIPYLAFTARGLPDVEESINSIIDDINLGESDYVSLYYVKDEETEKVKRLMVRGPADRAEQHLQAISSAEHENLLEDLFDLDFLKMRFQEKEKSSS